MPDEIVGPLSGLSVPRYAGPATFARLPRTDQVERFDVAVLGVPFDSAVTYRPGARFGPGAIRSASKLLRAYHPGQDVEPFAAHQVVDAGDVAPTPFDIEAALAQIDESASGLIEAGARVIALGGDHSIALPLLRAVARKTGPVALVHFDAHLDTQDSYFGSKYTHGTPFRRAHEEGLLDTNRLTHVGIRAPLHTPRDLEQDAELGFEVLSCADLDRYGTAEFVRRIMDRVSDAATYVSIDIDVLDPAFAPGTGTPEAGGFSTRELLGILRGMSGAQLVGADVVEVCPAYDHAEITSIAASHVAYELLGSMATARIRDRNKQGEG
jgi:agmatinase